MEEENKGYQGKDASTAKEVFRSEWRPVSPKLYRALAVLGPIVTVAAWGVFFFHGVSAVILAAAGLIFSLVGLLSGRGCLRDLAITSTIASAILIIVFCVFYWGLPYFVGKI